MKLSDIRRRITRNEHVQSLANWLIAQYLKFAYFTTSWTFDSWPQSRATIMAGEPLFVFLWHNRIAAMPLIWKQHPWRESGGQKVLTIVVSDHRDGRMVSATMDRFKVEHVPVSSKEKQLTAAKNVLRAIRAGRTIGMTPDGPRGPRMRMKTPAITLARLAGARIALIAYSVKRRVVLGSWDRFILPLPFNTGVILWEEGFDVPKDLDDAGADKLAAKIETALTALTNKADSMMGHEPIEAAPRQKA
jgi:hypothetical protein